MQKRAFSEKSRYNTVFDPLPVDSGAPIYFDKEKISLAYLEDFTHLHYHDRFEIGVCYSGEGLFISGTECATIKAGDVIFIPPNIKHYSRSLCEDDLCKCRFVYVNKKMIKGYLPDPENSKNDNDYLQIPHILHPDEYKSAADLLREVIDDCDSDGELCAGRVAVRIALFLLEAPRWFTSIETRDVRHECDSHIAAKVAPAAEYISFHYNEEITAGQLAQLCHLSESQLRRNFLLTYGKTPIAYRNNLRIRISEELLLRTDMTISDIAFRLGFQTSSDFCRMFKKHKGLSPTLYRKKNENK